MTPSRFQQIEAIYQAALKLGPDERAAHLASVCGNDAELRREVEALLAQKDHALESTMTMVGVGTLLGRYEIEALLGRAAWAKCSAHATRAWGVTSPSKSRTRNSASASNAKPARFRR